MENFVKASKAGLRRSLRISGLVKGQSQEEEKESPKAGAAHVHGTEVEQLDEEQVENTLRLFDLNPRFGPFVGVNRLFRWQRAEKIGLQPPTLVYELLRTDQAVPIREGGFIW